MNTYWNYENYTVEETDKKVMLQFNVAGVDIENILVKINKSILIVDYPCSEFVTSCNVGYKFEFYPSKQDVKVWVEDGILYVEITKPEDYEFEIKL